MHTNKSNMDKKVIWKLIESYFHGKHLERLVQHQIESYNYFVNTQLEKTINMFNVACYA